MRANGYVWILVGCLAAALPALAQRTNMAAVGYGRVTGVEQVRIEDNSGKAAGTIVGGALGLASGRGKSGSNKALRALGGAAAGRAVGGAMSGDKYAWAYTVSLETGGTVRVVTEAGGMQVGDCVAVERGDYNNIRRVSDVACTDNSNEVYEEHQEDADECAAAKRELLEADDDAWIERAARKVHVLCDT